MCERQKRLVQRAFIVGAIAVGTAACRVETLTPTVNVPDSSQTDTLLPPSPVASISPEIRVPSAQQPEAIPVPEPNMQMVYQNFNFTYFSNGLVLGGLLTSLFIIILVKRFSLRLLS